MELQQCNISISTLDIQVFIWVVVIEVIGRVWVIKDAGRRMALLDGKISYYSR